MGHGTIRDTFMCYRPSSYLMAAEQPKSDEMFCTSCGEVIKRAAEICPHCGVRHSEGPATDSSTESVGFVMAFVDLWKVKRPARHFIDLVMIFVSFGTYLGLYIIEALVHYYYLTKGRYDLYNEQTDTRIWSPLLK